MQKAINDDLTARFRALSIKELLPENTSYLDRERGYGQGDVRIGTSIEMDDSIYSLGFLSQICDDILD